MSLIEFGKTIHVVRSCFRFLGIWPEPDGKISSFVKFFVATFILTFFNVIPQTTKLYLVANNLAEVVEILTFGLLSELICLCKLISGWCKKQGNNL